MQRKNLVFIIIFSFMISPLYSAFEEVTYNARSFGMGEAFVAIADDNSAQIVNPAGLALIKRTNISAFYSKLFTGLTDGSDISDMSLSLTYPMTDFGVFSAGYFARTFLTSYSESLVSLALGKNIFEKVYLGVGLTNFSIATNLPTGNGLKKTNVSDIGAGFGAVYREEKFSLGVSLSGINSPNLNLTAENNKIEPTMRGGASYDLLLFDKKELPPEEEDTVEDTTDVPKAVRESNQEVLEKKVFPWGKISLAFELYKKDTESKLSFGSEGIFFDELFAVRAGYINSNKNSASFTAGFGINLGSKKTFSLDYGLNSPIKGPVGLLSHRMSLTLRFGEEKKESAEKKRTKRKRPSRSAF